MTTIDSALLPTEIGGQKVLKLTRAVADSTKPEFTSITLLPGRALALLQVTANFPGKGEIEVLASPDLAGAKQLLDHDDNENGDHVFHIGSAFLVPYPNRIRGKLSPDGKTVTTEWQGHSLTLPANNCGSLPTAERHALHGLILRSQVSDLAIHKIPGGEQVTGVIHADDFGGRWPSKTSLFFTVSLTADSVDTSLVAHNVGTEPTPIALAWHPYFNLPSGDRTQARLRIPAAVVAEVDNYDNVFATGKLLPVDGTKFDLREADGKVLGKEFYDDNWSQLDRKNGAATVRLVDPAAQYGVLVEGLSPEIKAIQVYAPPEKNFVAIEHQYNLNDPLGKQWGSTDTGLVTLKPGESTKWHVRLKVFVP